MAESYWDTISNAASEWLGISRDPTSNTNQEIATSSDTSAKRISPYSEISNTNNSTKLKDTIGGSDMSVFLLAEYPSLEPDELSVPVYLRKKDFMMLELDNVMSLSYSIMREKFPVRNLGHINPSAILPGARTISGSMAFAIFTDDILTYIRGMISDRLTSINQKFEDYYNYVSTYAPSSNSEMSYDDMLNSAIKAEDKYNVYKKYANLFRQSAEKAQLLDSLPPFHLLVMGVNEAGTFSKLLLKNVSIIDENQYQGTQQPHIMNKITFVATDIVPMSKFKNNKTVIASMTSVDEQFIYGNTQSYNYSSEVIGSSVLDSISDDINKDTYEVEG